MTRPDIFAYSDYRRFLADFQQSEKKRNRAFSHRFIIEKVGASSAGWFSDIVSGRINISGNHLVRLIRLLKLRHNEEAYLEALVAYDQAGSTEEKNHYFKKILAFKECKADLVGKDKFEFYSKWYYSALRELLLFYDFRDDYAALARKINPPIRVGQARRAIHLLESLGFIKRREDGVFKPVATTIKKDSSAKSLHLANFLRETMELGKGALDRHAQDSRDVSALTLCFSEENFQAAREALRSVRKQLLALAEADGNPAKVYQCGIQLFPLSR